MIYSRKGGKGKRTHRTIMEKILGRPLESFEQVHHKDGNTLNNNKDNLVICSDAAEHSRLHTNEKAFEACGVYFYRKCYLCHAWCDPDTMSQVQRKASSARPNAGNFFYHKACATANYHAKKDIISDNRQARRANGKAN